MVLQEDQFCESGLCLNNAIASSGTALYNVGLSVDSLTVQGTAKLGFGSASLTNLQIIGDEDCSVSVGRGAVASNVLISNNAGGGLYASNGGIASDVTVAQGKLAVDWNGTASNTVVSSGGTLAIAWNGKATSNIVSSGGVLSIESGHDGQTSGSDGIACATSNTIHAGGSLTLHEGAVLSSTIARSSAVVNDITLLQDNIWDSGMALSGGLVEAGRSGVLYVSQTAQNIRVESDASLQVSGTQIEDVTVEAGGLFHVYDNLETNAASEEQTAEPPSSALVNGLNVSSGGKAELHGDTELAGAVVVNGQLEIAKRPQDVLEGDPQGNDVATAPSITVTGTIFAPNGQDAIALSGVETKHILVNGIIAAGDYVSWRDKDGGWETFTAMLEDGLDNQWYASTVLASSVGYAIVDGRIEEGTLHFAEADDEIVIDGEAVLLGNIALGGGENTLTINGGAQINGDVTGDNLELTFNINANSTEDAVITANSAGALGSAGTKWTINVLEGVQNGRYVLARVETGVNAAAIENVAATVNTPVGSYEITFGEELDDGFVDLNVTDTGEIEFIYSNDFFVINNNLQDNCIFSTNNGTIALEFSKNIAPETFNLDMVSMTASNGESIVFTGYSINGKQLTLEYEPLESEGVYDLELSSAIQSTSGMWLDQNRNQVIGEAEDAYRVQLKTDITLPYVTRVEPAEDFAGTLTTLRVYFSKNMKLSSVQGQVELVLPNGTRIQPTGQRLLSGNCVELTVPPQTDIGQYMLCIGDQITDLNGNRLDTRSEGNTFESSFHIARIDLKVSDVVLSKEQASLGEVISVSWKDYNEGGYELFGSWTDGIYLSTDSRWDTGDILLGKVTHNGGLAEGEVSQNSIQASLAGVSEGNYYILVRSDIYMQKQGEKESALAAQNLEARLIQIDIPSIERGGDPIQGDFNHDRKSAYFKVEQN
ncbi:MAG: hypothetical protein J5746_13685, partial [Victivallales bacterium]|nr:hypothetical protein [Victivallales bacterium]